MVSARASFCFDLLLLHCLPLGLSPPCLGLSLLPFLGLASESIRRSSSTLLRSNGSSTILRSMCHCNGRLALSPFLTQLPSALQLLRERLLALRQR